MASNKTDELLNQLEENRVSLGDMINDVKGFRRDIDKLLPKKLDFRNKYMWEEKMKTISTVLSTELAIRKQIDDNIKSEITIREKLEDSDIESDRDYLEVIAAKIEDGTIKVEKPEGEPNDSKPKKE